MRALPQELVLTFLVNLPASKQRDASTAPLLRVHATRQILCFDFEVFEIIHPSSGARPRELSQAQH